jgi:hypothetical protein
MANHREVSRCRRKRADAGIYIKANNRLANCTGYHEGNKVWL